MLFRLSNFSWITFSCSYVSRNFCIAFKWLNLWTFILTIILYSPLVSVGSVVMSLHSFVILIICIICLLLIWLARSLSILLLFSKKQLWISLIFFYTVFFLNSIDFCYYLYDFPLSTCFDLIYSFFSIFLRWKLRKLI